MIYRITSLRFGVAIASVLTLFAGTAEATIFTALGDPGTPETNVERDFGPARVDDSTDPAYIYVAQLKSVWKSPIGQPKFGEVTIDAWESSDISFNGTYERIKFKVRWVAGNEAAVRKADHTFKIRIYQFKDGVATHLKTVKKEVSVAGKGTGGTEFDDGYLYSPDYTLSTSTAYRIVLEAKNDNTSASVNTMTTINFMKEGDEQAVAEVEEDEQAVAEAPAPTVSGAQVLLSTGTGFKSPKSWTGAGYGSGPNGWYVGDFDGDSRDDIFRYIPGRSGAEVLLSSGSSFKTPKSWTGAGYGRAPIGWYVGDFNGDGKDDILRYCPTKKPCGYVKSGAHVFLSTGSSFKSAGSWTGAGYGSGPSGWYVGDFNGDGKDDIFRYMPNRK